ncbi:hypothetical protein EVAR_18262_1 [Eumeta japonica]|uniref:Uncharacterized protein n=1 Tax=Eumeta variegata TaxID=151549 RepID=A0A4C1UJM5_EUMVA|nr:hypothetical protein EVAR_18262_1 [Eumeta japonica]
MVIIFLSTSGLFYLLYHTRAMSGEILEVNLELCRKLEGIPNCDSPLVDVEESGYDLQTDRHRGPHNGNASSRGAAEIISSISYRAAARAPYVRTSLIVQRDARNSAAVKLVTEASQWRKIGSRGKEGGVGER